MESYNRKDFLTIPPDKLLKFRKIYEEYVAGYRECGDAAYQAHIQIKYEHTEQVCREIRHLCHLMRMDPAQTAFAELIALLHDIGRYEQFSRYSTFADGKSENHAVMAVRITAGLGIFEELDHEQAEVLKAAILNHNLPRIPVGVISQVHLYSALLRDADKLDIWRVSLEYNIFHEIRNEALPDAYQVPPGLLKCFAESRVIGLEQVASYYDSILFRLSWLYDLNFPFTVRIFSDRGIAPKLLSRLPASPQLDVILEHISEFIRKSVKKN